MTPPVRVTLGGTLYAVISHEPFVATFFKVLARSSQSACVREVGRAEKAWRTVEENVFGDEFVSLKDGAVHAYPVKQPRLMSMGGEA